MRIVPFFFSPIQSMTEPLEELLGVIVNFLKPPRALKSAICLGSLQGHQLAGEISCIVDKAPKGMQPYLIAFLLKLVNPLENPLAACKLLDQLQKMDAESVLQPPVTVSFFSSTVFLLLFFFFSFTILNYEFCQRLLFPM